jgi:hypothetical protein
MKRRYALKQIMLATGVVGLFPSCYRTLDSPAGKLVNIDITRDEEKLLSEVVETIIPKTDTPGARELGVHSFLLKMINDCHEKEEQKRFVNGLRKLDGYSREKFGDAFAKCSPDKRQEILKSLSGDREQDTDLADFYKMTRGRTIQGYANSEYVMSNLVVYEMVPGRYNGYFPVATS